MEHEDAIKNKFFADQSADYDKTHDSRNDATFLGLEILISMVHHFGIKSVLDVGAGTGHKVRTLQNRCPGIRAIGMEPVAAMREAGYYAGIPPEDLVGGDATQLPFPENCFDVVAEFAVLHHVRDAESAIREMIRVARRGIFISDSNNFGQGSAAARMVKQMLYHCHLWPVANFIKTKGKGYTVSVGDGVAYSFSPFTYLRMIAKHCPDIYIANTAPAGSSSFRSAGDVAILALKRSQ